MVRRALGTLSVCVAALHAAGIPEPRLDSIFPPGGRAGSEVELTATGATLDGTNAMIFSHPGITAAAKDKRFVVKIAPDVPAGIYDARVSARDGVTNPRTFVVGALPEVVKSKPHTAIETAAELPLDTVFNGAATAAAADYFRFTAKQNQRVIIECMAAEIDSRLRPVLAVLDLAGRELAASRRGGVLDFTAPIEGVFVLKLHDLTFAGGADFSYRLAIRTGPRIDYVMPPCALPGTKTKFTLHGRNLPNGEDKFDVEIDVPAKADPRVDGLTNPAAVDGFTYRLGASNPVFIAFASAPVVAAQERVAPPCEIAGRFFPANRTDRYIFDAKKGDVWWIEVTSHRLGLPTNPFLLVQDTEVYASDKNAGGPRFSTASNDPVLRFEAKEDGPVRVSVRDLFGGARNDPRCVYHLAIRKESPDFRLIAVIEPPPEKKDDRTAAPRAAQLRASGTIAIRVIALRRDGFAGDIELNAEGLPSGVTSASTRIAAGANEGFVLLSAAEKPAAWAGSVRIVGKSGDRVREARGGAVNWAVTDFNTTAVAPRLTRDIALAVCAGEEAPVSITAASDKPDEIALKVTRRGEFKEALKLKANVAGVKEVDVAASATTATAKIGKLPAGEHTIYFEAQTKGKFRGKDVLTTIYSTPIRITAK